MSEQVATYENGHAELMEKVVVYGDLSKLTTAERNAYYNMRCRSMGLDPTSQPFAYIMLNGKLTLYALKCCTDQLRMIHKINLEITGTEQDEDIYTVRVRATMPDGRTDEDMGSVNIAGLKGEAKANAKMKAVTKAKRRTTISITSLGMLDESEVEDIPTAQPVVTVEKPSPIKATLPQGSTATPERKQAEARYLDAYTKARKAGMNPQPLTAYATSPLTSLDQATSDILDTLAAHA